MRILLTNDDGLAAPGIAALHHAVADLASPAHPIFTVAPLTVQSATGHGLTVHTPILLKRLRLSPTFEGIALDGRPADCVKVAVANIWPERFGPASRPDLVISGMNAGANAGINTIYSGTVAAALEAAFMGIPSIAVSLHLGRGTPDFPLAARHARRAIDAILKVGFPSPHACVSVNIPITEIGMPEAQTRRYPLKVCPVNAHGLNDRFEKRTSPGGDEYYWAAGNGLDFKTTDEGSDVQELFKRCITITPLRYDLTKKSVLGYWRAGVGEKVSEI
jgi:5'-nucleotidase